MGCPGAYTPKTPQAWFIASLLTTEVSHAYCGQPARGLRPSRHQTDHDTAGGARRLSCSRHVHGKRPDPRRGTRGVPPRRAGVAPTPPTSTPPCPTGRPPPAEPRWVAGTPADDDRASTASRRPGSTATTTRDAD